MKILAKTMAYVKRDWPVLLLLLTLILMCLVHAIPAGMDANFFAINGDFQNYNVVRRFLNGQAAYVDFTAYLGYGHLLLGSVLTFIFGQGHPTFVSSKMAFQFAAIFSLAVWVYAIFWAVLYKKGRILPFLAANIMLLLLLINPNVNASSITAPFFNGMTASLSTGVSARFLRSLAPVFFVGISIALYCLKLRFKFLNRSDSLSTAFVFGIPTGIVFYYSNDYGVSSSISITAVVFIKILLDRSIKLLAKLNEFGLFLLMAAISFVLFGTAITCGHFPSYLSATFGTGGAQTWYYNSYKSYYLWDLELTLWSCVQLSVVLLYSFVLIKKGYTKYNVIRYGIPLFFNMVGYAASNEYKLLSGNWLQEVSWTILFLTFCAEISSFFIFIIRYKSNSSLEKQISVVSSLGAQIIVVFVALSGFSWCISKSVSPESNLFTGHHGIFVENLGYFSDEGLARSIKSTDEFLKDDDVLFSTYASGVETYRNQFQPSGIDYVIHVLGNTSRTKYLQNFTKVNPEYVATARESYTGWEYWVKNANWFFYRELFQNYVPAYANDYQVFWIKSTENQILDTNSAKFSAEKIDDHSVRISVSAPSVRFGVADVNLKYKVKKKTSLRSLLTLNTMVFVVTDNSYRAADKDTYYLASQADGTPNSAIGIPIIDGSGSAVLTSEPSKNTIFDGFDTSLAGIYSAGYFNSVIVLNTVEQAGHHILTISNTPKNRQIIDDAIGIKIGQREYQSTFSWDGNSIFINAEALDNEALQALLGHSYFPVVQVIKDGYTHVSSFTDISWDRGVATFNPNIILFENKNSVKQQLMNAKVIESGNEKYSIVSVKEEGAWIHVTLDRDSHQLAFPAKLTIK